jgi:hypothetical protein
MHVILLICAVAVFRADNRLEYAEWVDLRSRRYVGDRCGAVDYVAPEQFAGDRAEAAAGVSQ